jgi:hypothetical protein
MPKEKATRKTKAKVADAGGKKKKGQSIASPSIECTADSIRSQILTRPSVVFPPICSSQMNSVTMSGRTTQESPLVRTFPPLHPMTSTHLCVCQLGQVGKVLGERWKALSAKQKEPYDAKAKADKERYESEKASYNVSGLASFDGVQ